MTSTCSICGASFIWDYPYTGAKMNLDGTFHGDCSTVQVPSSHRVAPSSHSVALREEIESVTSNFKTLIENNNSYILTYNSEIKEYQKLSLESDDPIINEIMKWMMIRISATNAKIDRDSKLLKIFENEWSEEKLSELKKLLPERIDW